jgi:hypothetical protein
MVNATRISFSRFYWFEKTIQILRRPPIMVVAIRFADLHGVRAEPLEKRTARSTLDKRMAFTSRDQNSPIKNAAGGAVGILIALLLIFALAGGGGYLAYNKYIKKAPLRTRLSSMKMREELVRFIHDDVSQALYSNLITVDDIVVMMNKELDRLKRIDKRFPDQHAIVAAQTAEFTAARDHLVKVMAGVGGKVTTIYVTWLVDRDKGQGMINAQKGTLTRELGDAIRGESRLIGRIRTSPNAV